MPHYVAIIEDSGEDDVSLWFPDLPGCISGGDDVEEALECAPEALAFYAQELTEDGSELPTPRTLDELSTNPEFADDIRNHTTVLIEFPPPADAAE
jgi:predicted RNase H-like HicB family nuclease